MNQEPHPDYLTAYQQAKAIRLGSMAALDDTAIKAYHDALDEGRSREEAEQIFFKHFNKKP
jgi:hypothetical protein